MTTKNDICPVCGGSGYRIVESEGHVGYAAPCDCAAARQSDARLRNARIPPQFAKASFETFSIRRDDNPITATHCSEAFRKVKTWAREFLEPRIVTGQRGLLLTGPPGTGKTHLAVAALKAVIAKGIDGLFFDYQTLLNSVAKTWGRDSGESERRSVEAVTESALLVIDDLGAQRALEWAEDIVTEIVTTRYNSQLPVIVTTNLPLQPVTITDKRGFGRQSRHLGEVIGERSRSRLTEMCKVIDMSALEDYRVVLSRR